MLMASFAYYCMDVSLVPDHVYDCWYARLKRVRWSITHPHLHLIDTSGRGSSGAIMLREDQYPPIVVGATWDWIKRNVR